MIATWSRACATSSSCTAGKRSRSYDGEEAVALSDTQDVNLFLMDVRMPRMNGVDAWNAIHEHHPEARSVLMTAYAPPEALALTHGTRRGSHPAQAGGHPGADRRARRRHVRRRCSQSGLRWPRAHNAMRHHNVSPAAAGHAATVPAPSRRHIPAVFSNVSSMATASSPSVPSSTHANRAVPASADPPVHRERVRGARSTRSSGSRCSR